MAKAKLKESQAVCGMDEDWKAESDLRTLIDAEKIKLDPARLKAAITKKKEMEKALKGAGE